MEKKYADYVIKRLSKTKTVIIYRRNNLSIKDLVKIDNGYCLRETYTYRGVTCKLVLNIYTPNIQDIFLVNTKTFKIRGGRNQFGIFIRMLDQNFPIKDNQIVGCVDSCLLVNGNKEKLYYDKQQKQKKEYVPKVYNVPFRTPIKIPNSVLWSARHHYHDEAFSSK